MLSPKGIELEPPTLIDRATGVLNGLPLSLPRKSRSSRSSGEVPGLPESRGIKGARGLDDPLVQKQGRRVRGLEGERAAAQEKKEERER